MRDFDIRESIRESAENVEIPESLAPERIEEKLQQADIAYRKSRQKNFHRRRNFYIGYAASAAVLLAVCCFVLFGGMGQGFVSSDSKADDKMAMQTAKEGEEADKLQSEAGTTIEAAEEAQSQKGVSEEKSADVKPEAEEEPAEVPVILPKEDAGELYRVAEDYGQVYDAIEQAGYLCIDYVTNSTAAMREQEKNIQYSAISDSAEAVMEVAEEESIGHSTTNLQTEGVDESDIVKTDGSFLYLISQNEIYILDITGGKPALLTAFSLPSGNASSDIVEIYVADKKLLVIAEETDTSLTEVKSKQYRTVSNARTRMYTYSLENPAEPVLLGDVSVDGYYYTSRKIDDMVYLFTDEIIGQEYDNMARDSEDWIPLAGGERIAADCIYIPESGSSSLIIASVDVDHPAAVVDNVMIINNSVDIYVSTEAVYLYHTRWSNSTSTEIAKFSLQDGIINAVGAASVKGRVQDTFAVNESRGMLRILTCSDSSDEGSSLYILDEGLSLTGKLEGIAPGETVYAARYLGNMAYFVTYRNMDPLFAADLSDPANPVILGELKITGYSDYLHMWTEGKMFGIGYETDPDNGAREGIKLSMFDISDPVNLSVSDSICITNADYSPALSQYKTVLADTQANLIGFVVTEYERKEENTYLLYQWKDGKLENLLTAEIGENAGAVRGLYAGDYFYIVTQQSVAAFSMTNEYERIGNYVLYK